MESGVLDAPARPSYRFALRSDPSALRQALDKQEPQGEAEILVAVFDVPDTAIAWGNRSRQIIERGAFRSWERSNPFPMRFFLDHGDALKYGAYSSRLLAGKVVAGGEAAQGLVIRTIYNLDKQIAREAFSDLLNLPEVVSFSFATDLDKEIVEVRDQQEHVMEMWPYEFGQVGEGAQDAVRLLSARTAIGAHSTSTSDAPWDAGANEKAYPAEAAALRTLYAWRKPDGDPDAKGSYKFPHHFADGKAASTRACSAGIGVLNGGRGGADIPGGDRQGIYAHLARHMRDADREVPALRSAKWSPDEVRGMMAGEEFMEAFGQLLIEDPARAEDIKRAAQSALAPPEPDPLNSFYRRIFSKPS